MSYEDDMYDSNEDANDNSNLVKKLRAKIDELSSRSKDLESENSNLKGSQRKQMLSSALSSRGYPAKIAAFIPVDIDLTDEAIDEWLSEYGDVFGTAASSTREQAPQQNAVIVGSAADAEVYRRMNAVESGAQAPTNVSGDILAQIESAGNMEDLMAALRGA